MASEDLYKILKQIARDKNIPIEELISLIQSALVNIYKRKLEYEDDSSDNVRVEINEKGLKVFCKKQIALKVKNPNTQISIDDAEKFDAYATINDKIEVEITPSDTDRIIAQTFKQVLTQKIIENERNKVFDEYENLKGTLVTGSIIRKDEFKDKTYRYILDFDKVEGILPYEEAVKNEELKSGKLYRFYLLNVYNEQKKHYLELSRTHPGFIKKLFELEVPEIKDNIVEVVSIVREAGSRTKMSVKSRDENIEPLGACIGINSSRIGAIIDEINGEKIDLIQYSNDPGEYIANALSPAVPISVEIDEENHHAVAVVPKKQLSLAIGKNGQNVRLAAKLTTWRIDIITDVDKRDENSN